MKEEKASRCFLAVNHKHKSVVMGAMAIFYCFGSGCPLEMYITTAHLTVIPAFQRHPLSNNDHTTASAAFYSVTNSF